jgi:hypothetical protein
MTSGISHTSGVPDEIPDRLLSPDGKSGWYAFQQDGIRIEDDDDAWRAPPKGSTIRFMGEHSADVPLWDENRLMFDTGEEMIRECGVGIDLAAEIVAWADQWHTRAGQPDHDAAGEALARRLQHELADRYTVVYKR